MKSGCRCNRQNDKYHNTYTDQTDNSMYMYSFLLLLRYFSGYKYCPISVHGKHCLLPCPSKYCLCFPHETHCPLPHPHGHGFGNTGFHSRKAHLFQALARPFLTSHHRPAYSRNHHWMMNSKNHFSVRHSPAGSSLCYHYPTRIFLHCSDTDS